MKATKQSVSIPQEMNQWIEFEMSITRRSRSSIIQEAVELLRFARLSGKSESPTPLTRKKQMIAPFAADARESSKAEKKKIGKG